MTKHHRTPTKPAMLIACWSRLGRLKGLKLPRNTKIQTVRRLVINLFAWTDRPTKAALNTLRTKTEAAMLGKMHMGRSRFLVWAAALGPSADPIHAMDTRTINYFVKRINTRTQCATIPSRRLNEVAVDWGWTISVGVEAEALG